MGIRNTIAALGLTATAMFAEAQAQMPPSETPAAPQTSAPAAPQKCPANWVDAKDLADALSRTPVDQWDKKFLSSIGAGPMADVKKHIQTGLQNDLTRASDRIFKLLERDEKEQQKGDAARSHKRQVNWGAVLREAPEVINPALSKIKAGTSSVAEGRTEAAIAINKQVGEILKAVSDIKQEGQPFCPIALKPATP